MTDKEILEINQAQRQVVECWTRSMGYYRPVSHFNVGKKSEFAERQWFTEDRINAHMTCDAEQRHAV